MKTSELQNKNFWINAIKEDRKNRQDLIEIDKVLMALWFGMTEEEVEEAVA